MRVLVTGAASGLGLALARRLTERGDRVLATDLAAEPPDAVKGTSAYGGNDPHTAAPPSADGGTDALTAAPAAYRRLDVRSETDWDSARAWVEEEWGGLDVLM